MYTVSKSEAEAYIASQPQEPKLALLERRSYKGWGVWNCRDQHWVFVAKEKENG